MFTYSHALSRRLCPWNGPTCSLPMPSDRLSVCHRRAHMGPVRRGGALTAKTSPRCSGRCALGCWAGLPAPGQLSGLEVQLPRVAKWPFSSRQHTVITIRFRSANGTKRARYLPRIALDWMYASLLPVQKGQGPRICGVLCVMGTATCGRLSPPRDSYQRGLFYPGIGNSLPSSVVHTSA